MDDSATILWRRLDLPGRDTPELARIAGGWCPSGVAVLAESARPCRLEYRVTCDMRWHTRRCSATGYIGPRPVTLDRADPPEERPGPTFWLGYLTFART